MDQQEIKEWPSSYQTFKTALNQFGRQIWPATLLMLMHLTWFFFVASVALIFSSIGDGGELLFDPWITGILTGLSSLYFVLLSIAAVRLAEHEQQVTFVSLFSYKTWTLFIPFAVLLGLYTFMVVGGTFLFIVPGVLAFIYFSLAPYNLVWSGFSVIESFRQSYYHVKHFGWHILYRINFFFFLVGITRIFAIVPGSGQTVSFILSLFITLFAPFYMGEVYRQVILGQKRKRSEFQLRRGQKVLVIVYALLAIGFLSSVTAIAGFIAEIYPYPFASLSVF